MKLTFWEVAQAVEASNDWQQWPDFPLTGIEFDVPLQGENDGHRFIESAMANGCQAAFLGTGFSRCAATIACFACY